MCFIANTPDSKVRKIAQTHLLVYKAGNKKATKKGDKLVSPYRGHRYTFGKTTTSRLDKPDSLYNSIYIGLHAYRDKNSAKKYHHSQVYPAIVPKDAEYYINNSEVVCTKLIVFRNAAELKAAPYITSLDKAFLKDLPL